VCPRLLKDCAAQLCQPLHKIFNLSLQLGRVPALWKTSCVVPVPKIKCPAEMNDYRPVDLGSPHFSHHEDLGAADTTPTES